jgi:hypothetical protein
MSLETPMTTIRTSAELIEMYIERQHRNVTVSKKTNKLSQTVGNLV